MSKVTSPARRTSWETEKNCASARGASLDQARTDGRIARSTDRVDRFDRFDKLFAVFPHFGLKYVTNVTSSTSRSILCESFSLIRRILSGQTSKKQNCIFLHFCQFRFDRFDNSFDSIDIGLADLGGPPWRWLPCLSVCRLAVSTGA